MAQTEQVAEAEAPKGLDAILDAAIDEHTAEPEAPAAEPEKPAAAATDGDEPKLDSTGRAHGSDGKFVPKGQPAKAAPEAAAPATTNTEQATAADTAPQAQQVQLPDAWSADWKARIATLPPEQQQLVVDQYKAMQGDYTRKSQEFAEQRRAFEPLVAEIQRQAPFLQHIGYSPDRFMAESAAVAQRLMSGSPEHQGQAIAYLAQLHHVPPEAILRHMGISLNPGEAVQANPEISQLRQQVFELTQALGGMQQQSVMSERERAQAEFAMIGQSKDQNGAPKFPHFERVKDTMIRMVANDIAQTWDEAYIKAVRGDDELYKLEVENERKRVAEQAEKERLAAVEKAKGARPVKTSNSIPGGATQAKGLDAHLNAALERAGFA